MGNFYTNITLLSSQKPAVVNYLRAKSRDAFVTAADRFVVVYESASETQDEGVLCSLAAGLSEEFNCPALAVLNHDDDILCYFLFQSGRETDRYNSAPNYFEGEPAPPAGGDIPKLISAFQSKARPAALAKILHACAPVNSPKTPEEMLEEQKDVPSMRRKTPAELAELLAHLKRELAKLGPVGETAKYAFSFEQHLDLVNVLGLPECAVGTGYNSLENGEFPDDLAEENFERT
jgi:hypothetical protein